MLTHIESPIQAPLRSLDCSNNYSSDETTTPLTRELTGHLALGGFTFCMFTQGMYLNIPPSDALRNPNETPTACLFKVQGRHEITWKPAALTIPSVVVSSANVVLRTVLHAMNPQPQPYTPTP